MTKIIAFNRNRRIVTADTEQEARASSVKLRRQGGAPVVSMLAAGAGTQAPAVGIAASIVVPSKGRPQLLNRCLASLVMQQFDTARFEIIVVDDGPSDDTRDVVAGWAAQAAENGLQVTYIPSMGPHGPAAARNHGWRAARGAIIAFTDDDTVARPDWLKNGVLAFASGVHAVCGSVVMPLEGTPTDYEKDAKNLETAEFVTANCFCLKKVLEDLGGFDERFRFAWREDSDLHFRLIDYGANIVREPKAVMMHPIRPAQWGVSLQQVKKVQFDALLYKKHPSLYRRRIRAKPRWDFYLTVGALLTTLAATPAGAVGTAIVSGTVWTFMTGRFCLQRLSKTSKAPSHVLEMLVTSILIPPLAVFWRAVGAFKFRVGFL
ncbi:glycosyltransferase family 2 protein [Noviherbaspirillum malthae]|uniref:glycosyltransferase family 2 protein n=1 Tax=Noviherbaspirillum malthae TaxID=1260987 RepID=UPI001E570AF4|nr:glycosyltransferase [Noviherbaspirillum malthae]